MAQRYRSKPGKVYTGYYNRRAKTPSGATVSGYKTVSDPPDESWDTVHSPPFASKASDLTLKQWDSKPARVTAYYEVTRESRRVVGIPLLPGGSAPVTGEVGWIAMQTRALAAIQQSDPIADVITDTAEIIGVVQSLPRLALKSLHKARNDISALERARKRIGDIAGAQLSYAFVVAPLVRNLEKMIKLQQEVAKRLQQHRRKMRTKRATGKASGIAVLVSEGSTSNSQWTNNGSMNVKSDQSASLIENKAWWVAKLQVRDDFDFPGFMEEQVTVGFQSGVEDGGAYVRALYEIIPWSFLIDYFTTLGSVIKYNSNRVVYDVPQISLMASYTVERQIKPKSWSGGSQKGWQNVTDGWQRLTYKRRKIAHSPGVWVAFDPVLSNGQILNLASLAAVFASGGR